jgi:hypothetical protein
MRRAVAMVVAMLVIAGCGGGSSSTGTGGHGGGATGAGGAAGVTGAGGSAGVTSAGGAAGSGLLPACAILALPATDGGACTALVAAGPLVTSVPVNDNFQGGVVEDGGLQVKPAGGAILDGDYDLVRWENRTSGAQTRRTIRVFGGGSYVEWDAAVMNGDAGFIDDRYDTRNIVSGHTFAIASVFCSVGFAVQSYGYTVTGDDLVFFDYTGLVDGNGDVSSVDTYQRTCTRP